MTCVRLNTGWKYCLVGVLGGMGLAIPYAVATGKVDIVKEPKEHREFYGTGIIVTKANVAEVKKGGGALDFNDLWGKATGQIQYRG